MNDTPRTLSTALATMAIAAAVAMVTLPTHAAAQTQTRDQQSCINAMNKDSAKVSRAQHKDTARCLKLAGKGLLGLQTAQDCIEADGSGKVGVASSRTLADQIKRCSQTPDFGYSGAVNSNQSAVEEAQALMADVFGTPLENAILTADGTKCQGKVVSSISKIESAILKQFQRCVKDGLKSNAITTPGTLEGCFDSVAADLKGKIGKGKAKLLKTFISKCFGANPPIDIAGSFAGSCVGDAGSSSDLSTCVSNAVDCRACRMANLVDNVFRDCDLFDDDTANLSCDTTVPSCDDVKQNQDETDIDCGGTVCPACPDGSGCAAGSDCDSDVCIGNICQAPTCIDVVANGNETDVDCGGAICPTCPDGSNCLGGSDCTSLVCAANMCSPANCIDLIKNGDETGVDCGGSCPGCPSGQGCNDAADCLSMVCTGNICQPPSCSDGLMNGDEGDVDCGGTSCAGCPDGGTCNVAGDCNSGVCSGGGICLAGTCSDGVNNQDETGIDCGGAICGACPIGQGCAVAGDCLSAFCSGANVCACPANLFTFNIGSNNGGVFDSAEWPGGTQAQNGPTGCDVSINNPSDNIDLAGLLGDDFEVIGFTGYSTCFGTGGEDGDGCQPDSCPPLGIPYCEARRPSCTAALNGSGSARFFVQCNP